MTPAFKIVAAAAVAANLMALHEYVRAMRAAKEVERLERQMDVAWRMAPSFGISLWFNDDGTVTMTRLEPENPDARMERDNAEPSVP